MLAWICDIPRRCWNFIAIVWCGLYNGWIAPNGGDGHVPLEPALIPKRAKDPGTKPS